MIPGPSTRTLVPVLVLVLAWAGPARSLPLTLQATLSGAAESPANASPGSGTATVTYDAAAHTLEVQIAFAALLGTTTASHIHCCVAPDAVPSTAGVATAVPSFPGFPAGVTSGSYLHTFDLTDAASWNPAFVTAHGGTTAGAEAAFAAALEDGSTYLNIHTNLYPAGEIRGFFVPEPATGVLLASALAALAGARRRSTRA